MRLDLQLVQGDDKITQKAAERGVGSARVQLLCVIRRPFFFE